MGEALRYWQFVGIDAAGNRRIEIITAARTFFEQQFSEDETEVADASVQRQLLAILRGETEASAIDRQLAEFCLRCFVSQQSASICRELVTQFGQKGGFTWSDLYCQVLDDRMPPHRRPSASDYQSVATRILQTVDLNLSQLSTWTKRLVTAELNPFLLECGIYIASDWSLLNLTPDRLRRICTHTFQLPAAEVEIQVKLLTTYHDVYRRDRLQQLGSRSRRKYAPPTVEQLDQMVRALKRQNLHYSAQELFEKLQTLAQFIRQTRCPKAISIEAFNHANIEPGSRDNALVGQSPLDVAEESEETQQRNQLLRQYRQDLLNCLAESLREVINQHHQEIRQDKPEKAFAFLLGLCLFHCERRSMSKIAKELQLGTQSTVSRLLKLDQLRANVRQTLLLKLRDRVKALAETYTNRDRLEAIDQHLDAILADQVDPIIAAAEAEAATANRSRKSLFAQHLCHYLRTQNIALCTR